MIIKFSFSNFRSVKNKQEFSLEATGGLKLKPNNTFNPFPNKKLSLLKSAVLYGANASGKSNLIRAFWSVKGFILNSTNLKSGDLIHDGFYDPFLLDNNSRNEPLEFEIDFISFDKKKYNYKIKYNKEGVIEEYLGVYETAWISKIFSRVNGNEFVEFGDGIKEKSDKKVSKNNLYLTLIGNTPNEQIRNIYLYFKSIEVCNVMYNAHVENLSRRIQTIFSEESNSLFRKRLSKLISVADTKIDEVAVEVRTEEAFKALPDEIREKTMERYKYQTFGIHKKYDNNIESGFESFNFLSRESQGTNTMFSLGGMILEAFQKPFPVVVFFDELDNSLHPDLVRFLVELFHNPKINKNNSQLIFATHETTLLDKYVFRKDQIWFAEKDKYGITDFFSLKDFKELKNLRSDIAFDKWYRTGKFGAVPNIRKIEFLSEYEQD